MCFIDSKFFGQCNEKIFLEKLLSIVEILGYQANRDNPKFL